ncbi:MAG: molybdenum cofactor guanylyltransferase [Calditrichaeota bacterium]|nr:molybdenum cofactor guanylyltransferase [Calditrichota bacterium]
MNVYILCGGKNSRFNYKEKALEPINGESSIQLLINQLNRTELPLTLISNNPAYKQFELPTIPDEIQDIGPLGALFTALNHSDSDWIFLIAADMPFFQVDLIRYLSDRKMNVQAVIPSDKTGLQPLAALYHRSCIDQVKKQIETGGYGMYQLIKKLNCNLIPIDHQLSFYTDHLFFNMNDMADLEKARRIYADSKN